MPNFLEKIFAQLQRSTGRVVLREIRSDHFVSFTGKELLDQVEQVRDYLRSAGLQRGDRIALLGANSVQWIAANLAIMAEGFIVVPLYSRQAPAELAAMMQDCQPRLLFAGSAELSESVARAWTGNTANAPRHELIQKVLSGRRYHPDSAEAPNPRADSDIATIIYTSGTSGEAKGVCLNVGNLTHMLGCTTERLDLLMGQLLATSREPDRVFHYLPFNFAASWILALSCLCRETVLTLSTDLNKLADEIRLAAPNYFLNVPTLLERVRRGVDEALSKRGRLIRAMYAKARDGWQRQSAGRARAFDAIWVVLGRNLIFRSVRARFGPNLRALICGSAPLAPETQQFFLMLGISVLQGYGLTETTGICTLDDPRVPVEPGYVGSAITGIEMTVADNEEIVVRGPHIFAGYWNRPEETTRVMEDGWFHTGDQGEVNVRGNWRIIGRIKNLIILNSGHNIAPEPIEDRITQLLPEAQQVVLVGNGRGYLCALVTGSVTREAVQAALDGVNPGLPHYRQIRNFQVLTDTLTPESGLLTANGKLRREAIGRRYASEINAMYDRIQPA